MVAGSIGLCAVLVGLVVIHGLNFTGANLHLSTGVNVLERIKSALGKWKQYSIFLTNLLVCTIAYWIGVSISFFFWKLHSLRKREEGKDTFWLEVVEREEDYKSQY